MSDDANAGVRFDDDFGASGAALPPTGTGAGRLAPRPARRLVDRDRTVTLDNGAVRFAPPPRQGWGRAALAYGPFERRHGLAMAAYLLNNHNTAQVEPLPESLKARLDRWLRASGQEGRLHRFKAWLRSGRVRRTLRLFRWWWGMRKEGPRPKPLDENLAVGWYAAPAPLDPVRAGQGFVMHAAGADNGELWICADGRTAVAARAVPDIPLGLVVVLREAGAIHYAAATPEAGGLPGYPWVRPVGLDVRGREPVVHAVVSPAAFGQIGFRIDTRVYGVQVASPEMFAPWCGAAVAADRLLAGVDRDESLAERGGAWKATEGVFERTDAGLKAVAAGVALLPAAGGIGLVHVLLGGGEPQGGAGLVVRAADARNLLRLTIAGNRCWFDELCDGEPVKLGEPCEAPPASGPERAVQLTLDGTRVTCAIDGRDLLTVTTSRAAAAGDGTGLHATGAGAVFRDFEAHPDRLLLPEELRGPAVALPEAAPVLVTDRFEGEPGPLAGRTTTTGSAVWSREFGVGLTEVTGEGSARVVATAARPNPGRTAYTIAWNSPRLAELEMEMTIPGVGVGEWHKPRGGFLFWQDPRNHLIISLWRGDEYPGASVSSFYHIDGFEDIYDAVWSNIGRRAWYGDKVRLRVAFDGEQFLASLDGEPVLYRRLTDVYPACRPLVINRVGIVANWEWGDDTGTVYRDFTARGLAPAE